MATKIYIDQGHNPSIPNGGAEGNGLKEQDITFRVGILLADLLTSNGNYEVKLSRPTASTSLGNSNSESLRIRVNEANRWGADYFISIHANASDFQSANGVEAYAYSTRSKGFALGQKIVEQLSGVTGLRNRGMKTNPSLYVLRRTAMPAVLVEIGFITNAYEANLMNTKPELFARGIYLGIVEYFGN